MLAQSTWAGISSGIHFALAMLLTVVGTVEAGAAQCSLSGKRIYYKDNYCTRRGCFHSQMILSVVGDKILSADEAQTTGLIFYLGKTVDATEDPAQKGFAKTLQPPNPNTGKRVMTAASYEGDTLILKQDELFYTNRTTPELILTYYEQISIPSPSCNTCKHSGTFDARWANGQTEVVRYSAYLCEITDLR